MSRACETVKSISNGTNTPRACGSDLKLRRLADSLYPLTTDTVARRCDQQSQPPVSFAVPVGCQFARAFLAPTSQRCLETTPMDEVRLRRISLLFSRGGFVPGFWINMRTPDAKNKIAGVLFSNTTPLSWLEEVTDALLSPFTRGVHGQGASTLATGRRLSFRGYVRRFRHVGTTCQRFRGSSPSLQFLIHIDKFCRFWEGLGVLKCRDNYHPRAGSTTNRARELT